jgi:Xaa-Pro aminopeptidase
MKYSIPVFILFVFCSFSSNGQFEDTDRLSAEFHKERRAAFRKLMPEKSIAFIFANPVRNRSNDVDFQYSQNVDLYYLSGYLEPNAILVILKEAKNFDGNQVDELFFAQKQDKLKETWKGRRLGDEGVIDRLKFKAAYNAGDFAEFGIDITKFDKILVQWPDLPNHDKDDNADLSDLVNQLQDKIKNSKENVDENAINSAMAQLRQIKKPEELVLMQKAIDVTNAGFFELFKSIKPGMMEYEAQAIVEYYSRKNGSEYQGYGSICGGGENACILHYTTNRKQLVGEDLFLGDMGAEYHGYTADITRTIPVDGKFSVEEATLYNLVLKAQNAGIEKCRTGNPFSSVHQTAKEVIAQGLVDLGIIQNKDDYKKYFMHGTSHYLGLDVHDAGSRSASLQPGMVITVEPGIYIESGSKCDPKWWGKGIRIEDDILITEADPINMSGALPRTITEIEALMSKTKLQKEHNE